MSPIAPRVFLDDATRLLDGRASVGGLCEGAAACLIAQALRNASVRRPTWVIVPTEDVALRMEEALVYYLEEEGERAPRVLPWPQDELPPYSGLSPRPSVNWAHIEALDALLFDEPAVIVASAASLPPRVCHPDVLLESCLDLVEGRSIDRKGLLLVLADMGYLSVAAVEDPGTFAARGGLVELWPVGDRWPARVELLDDEIERIRRFDPASRRGRDRVSALHVPPAREWSTREGGFERFLDRTRALVGGDPEANALRRRVLETLRAGLSFAGVEDWLPALVEVVDPFDFAPEARRVVWDLGACLEEVQAFLEKARRRHGDLAPDERPLVAPEERMASLEDLSRHLRESTMLEPLAVLGSVPARSRPNTDLRVRKADLSPLVRTLRERLEQGWRLLAVASSASDAERVRILLETHGLHFERAPSRNPARLPVGRAFLDTGDLPAGFTLDDERLCVVASHELLLDPNAEKLSHPRRHRGASEPTHLDRLREGDWVVHEVHGIGRYLGMARLEAGGANMDFLRLEYRDGDLLYLPVHKLDLLTRFRSASETSAPRADRLGGVTWQARRARVKDAMLRTAHELLELHAHRELQRVEPPPPRGAMMLRFESLFPHALTPDQARAIQEVLGDLEADRPMDRLVVGDVGFGKTEVAMRAAARMVEAGRQVAVLCPTTVLAYQHHETWNERFDGFPVRIAMLSRFTSAGESRGILEGLRAGSVDVLIATTRLLGRRIAFRDLGLLVVDEEHRFGVGQKERLKKLGGSAHLLSLSATPIPRTLSMALSGVRAFSSIGTPPEDRLPVTTRIARFDGALLREEILREMRRGGQVFFVHNRIASLPAVTRFLEKLVPEARIRVTHGEMGDDALEEALVAFVRRQADVLLTTAIIESGVDLPNVNCMIIHRADRFGLAQLYQLRGRVGRSYRRGRCILLVPSETGLSRKAVRRLRVLQDHQGLGAGFRVANEDLELRGAGELLGSHQHGHMDALGVDACMELLSEAVAEARGQIRRRRLDPDVEIPVSAFIPEALLPDTLERLAEYRRGASCETQEALRRWVDGLEEQHGSLPEPLRNLGWLMETRLRCRVLGIARLAWLRVRVEILLGPDHVIPPARLARRLQQLAGRLERPEANRLSLRFDDEEARHPFRVLHWLLRLLETD